MFVRLLLSLLGVAATVSLQAAAPSHWQWSNPLPHRQNWTSVAAGNGHFVGLTDGMGGRWVYHSVNGVDWEQVSLNGDYRLSKVVFLNGSFLAMGDRDVVLSSVDGLDWQLRHQNGAGTILLDAAYGNGKLVAMGYNTEAYVADSVGSWAAIEGLGSGYSLTEVEFGNGVFLAFGGKLLRSSDGVAWTELARPGFLIFDGDAGFAFNNGKFLLSGSNGTAVSTDGATWTPGEPKYFRRIVATTNGFLGITRTTLEYSQDGLSWQELFETSDETGAPRLNSAVAAGGTVVAAGDAGILVVGANGQPMAQVVGNVDYTRSSVVFGNGVFIRYGSEDGNFISDDGKTWTFNAGAPGLSTLAGGNGVWVGLKDADTAAISTDGIGWADVTLPSAAEGRILFAGGLFLVATDGGVMSSSDGQVWETEAIAGVSSVRLIGHANGIFAGMSNGSRPVTSTDGRDWTVHAASAEMGAQFYAAGNGRFVGIRGGGMGPGSVVYSTDGVIWSSEQLGSGATHIYTSLEFGGGYFLMTDNYGEVHSSADGIHWSGERQAPQRFTGSAYGDGAWVLVGGDSVLHSAARALAASVVTLQISRANSTWSLNLTGAAGQQWLIESAAAIGGEWKRLTSVQIPVAGRVAVPLNFNPGSGFFRAVRGE